MHYSNLFSLLLGVVQAEYVDIDKDQRRFLKDLDLSGTLFNPRNWYLHNTDLFRRMKEDHARAFVNNLLDDLPTDGQAVRWKEELTAKTFFTNIRGEDIESIKERHVCEYLGLGINFNPTSFAHAGERCARELVKLANDQSHVLEALPAEIFKSHPQLASEAGNNLFKASGKTLGLVLDDPNVCKYIKASYVRDLSDRNIIRMITPRCFARLKDVYSTDFSNISDFRNDILGKITTNGGGSGSLTTSTLSSITREQIRETESFPEVCGILKINQLSDEAASGIGPKCMFSSLKAADEGQGPLSKFGDLWLKFGRNVLDLVLQKEPRLIRNIFAGDFEKISTDLTNTIFKFPEACANISGDAKLALNPNIKIEKGCFSKLSTKLQPIVLVKIKSPPNDLLARINSKMMSNWSYRIHGTTLRGFQVLRTISTESSIALIERLSTEIDGDHACASIPNAGTLLTEKWFVNNITESCTRALLFSIRPSEGEKHPRVWILQNIKKVSTGSFEHQKQILPHITADILKMIISNSRGAFCESIKLDFFKLLPSEAKMAISKDCFPKISFKKHLTSTDMQSLPTDVLAKVSAHNFDELSWNSIPDTHFQALSTELPRDGPHALQCLDKSTIYEWDVSKITRIEPKLWVQIPATSFSGLTEAHIKGLSRDVFKYWSYEQVKSLRKGAVMALSAQQIRDLGSRVDPTAVRALESHVNSMGETEQKFIKEQISKSPFGWKSILIYGYVGVCILVLVGLFFYHFPSLRTIFRFNKDKDESI